MTPDEPGRAAMASTLDRSAQEMAARLIFGRQEGNQIFGKRLIIHVEWPDGEPDERLVAAYCADFGIERHRWSDHRYVGPHFLLIDSAIGTGEPRGIRNEPGVQIDRSEPIS